MDMSEFIVVINTVAAEIAANGNQGASRNEWTDAQAMVVVEEAGEFIGEYRRNRGFARRAGNREDMLSELADVVISSMAMFYTLREDPEVHIKRKLKKIVTRGYVNKEPV
jgi:NTP pyrophosphatase (non-canonical NTP hydrolase)